MKNSVRFIAYYLVPFVVNSITVYIIWNASILVGFIVMDISLVCNILWAWNTPNQRALTTALLAAFSWVYAVSVRELLRYTPLVWDFYGVLFVGIIGAVILFVFALIASNKRLRRNQDGWKSMTGKRRASIVLTVIIVASLCMAILFSAYVDACRKQPYISAENFGLIPNLSAKAGFPLGTNGSKVYYMLKGLSTDDYVYAERLEFLEVKKEVYVSINNDTVRLSDLPIKYLHVTYNGEKTTVYDEMKIRELIVYIRNQANNRPIADSEETVPLYGQDIANAHIVFDLPCDLTWQIEMERTPHGTVWVHMPYETGVYDVTHILGEYFSLQ